MARGKNATALFEVIHTSKRPPKASPSGGIPAPRWWSKGGGKAAEPEQSPDEAGDAAPPAEPSGGTRRSWLAAARKSAEQQPAAVEPAYPDEQESAPPVADEEPPRVVITRRYPLGTPERSPEEPQQHDQPQHEVPMFAEPPEAPLTEDAAPAPAERPWMSRQSKVAPERAADFDPTADVGVSNGRLVRPEGRLGKRADEPAPRQPRVRRSAGPTPSAAKGAMDSAVSLDHDAGEVRFRLSYAGAILAAVILLIVIVIAYLAGRTGGESAADLSASVGGSPPAATVASGAAGPAGAASGMMAAVSPTPPAKIAPTPATPPTPAAAPLPAPADDVAAEPPARRAGLMYAVVQSYPDRETARRAADFLDRKGVACTVVPALSGFALRDWYSVVGLQPFPRGVHGSAVQNYLAQVTQLGQAFSTKSYNQFRPQLYTWRADSDVPRP